MSCVEPAPFLVEPPPSEYSLHVSIVGTVTVSTNHQGIDCPGTCTTDVADGTIIDLIATPAPSHTFDTWTGDPDCSDGRLTMTGDRTCVATFREASGFMVMDGGETHTLAIDPDVHGQIGDGSTSRVHWAPTHATMPADFTFTVMSGGGHHSLAIDHRGDAWVWGENFSGQIGDGTSLNTRLIPTSVHMP